MSIFDEENQDAYRGTIDQGSVGPRLGFLASFDAARDATTKAHSLLAVEQGLRAVEQQQIKKMREAGLRPPDSLDDAETSPAMTMFRQGRYNAAAQSIVNGDGWYTDEMVAARDEHIKGLQRDRPDLGLMTYGEMFKKVQADAQEAERQSEMPKTIAGHVGAFLGEAAGTLSPTSNPLNFATLGIGGGGGIVGRAAVQGISQFGTEAVTLAASNPENLLLGRERTTGDELHRLAMAGAAGVAADLGFQGIGAGYRRLRTGKWFVDQPLPPAAERYGPPERHGPPEYQGAVAPDPPAGRPLHEYPDWETFARVHGEDVSPYGKSREAALRAANDLDHVANEMQRWDGPRTFEIRPPETATAIPGAPDLRPVVSSEGALQRYMDNLETVDDIVRRTDPDTFSKVDKIEAEMREIRQDIDANKGGMFEPQTPRGQADLAMRTRLLKLDAELRDLAPLITRAYKAAEKEWRTTPIDHNTIDFLKQIEERSGFRYRENGKSLTEEPLRVREPEPPPEHPPSTGDTVPLASMEPDIDKRLHVDTDDAATRVTQQVAHSRTKLDEKVETFVASAQKLSKLTAEEIAETSKLIEKDLDELRAKRSAATLPGPGERVKTPAERAEIADAIASIEKELDELHNVTFPDGRKLSLDKDFAPYIRPDGTVEHLTVRDYLREMARDADAHQSVVTCSRPS